MPELPEVETIAKSLRQVIVGQRIRQVHIYRPSLLETPVAQFIQTLQGQKIGSVKRRGKYLLFQLENQFFWITHLRMTGKYICLEKQDPHIGLGQQDPHIGLDQQDPHIGLDQQDPHIGLDQQDRHAATPQNDPTTEIAKHAKVLFELDQNNLVYQDTRCLGKLGLYKNLPEFINRLGPEPLSKTFSLKTWHSILQKRKTNLKSLLLNQQAIAGVGNIYANEALFAAQLHPARAANSLSQPEGERLYQELKRILNTALRHNGTTIQDFRGVDQKTGQFQKFLQVYGKQNIACTVCLTKIQRMVQQQRSTFFCPHCQKA